MRWLPLLFLATAAQAQTPPSYLVHPDLATCQARSAAMCTAMKCDGVQTKYWWNCLPLTDGTAAMEIQPSGDFSKSASNTKGSGALTLPEQAALVPATMIAAKLPTDPAPK